MIGVGHPQPLALQLMQCLQLTSHIRIFVLIHTVQSVKKDLSWVLRLGKCHVTIFITLTVLFLGWFSITHVQFAVLSCHLRGMVVLVVTEIGEEGMPTAAVTMVILGAGILASRTKEGGIHCRSCGHSVHLVQTLIIMLRLGEAALQILMSTIVGQVIADGPIITKV